MALLQSAPNQGNNTNATITGTIVQVIGPVVDAEFSDTHELPEIYNSLEVD
ncbi:MAG: hypothetical protein JOY96_11800, partial [Verrucomicrobia bacterium]|nr:hypothetical protein [Verrucomicrobiota bacterium]